MVLKVIATLVAIAAVVGVVVLVSGRNDDVQPVASATPTAKPTAQPTSITGSNPLVRITKDGIEPNELRIKVGQTVTFRNDTDEPVQPASDPHPQHTNLAGFDAKKGMERGEVFEFTFTKAGRWTWHDHLAPSIRGTIIVE